MRRLFLLALVVLASVSAYAQMSKGQYQIIPKIGLSMGYLSGTDAEIRTGFMGGAEVEYQSSNKFSVIDGVYYSQQGVKDGNEKIKLDYINIAILANYYLGKGFAVKAGIQPGFCVNSEYQLKQDGVKLSMDVDTNVDFSIPFGVSWDYKFLRFDARYNLGLTHAIKNSDSKNRVFQLSIGYKFTL